MKFQIKKYSIAIVLGFTIGTSSSMASATVNPYPVTLRGLSAYERVDENALEAMNKNVNIEVRHSHNDVEIKHKSKKLSQKQKKETNFSKRIQEILKEEEELKPVIPRQSQTIMGEAIATREQCLEFLIRNNPNPKLTVSPREIVDYYYEEAQREGIRPDAAFAQALKETGYFRYGGTVVPEQNNFCGLGTTSSDVRGAYFSTARIGVRAHIQHLKAYASVFPPKKEIVDPRYTLVRTVYGASTITHWQGLNGRWAVPGHNYGQEILQIVDQIVKI